MQRTAGEISMEGQASGGLFETPPFVVEIEDALSRESGALRGQCFYCKRETVVWPFVLPAPVVTNMRVAMADRLGIIEVTIRTLLTCNECSMRSMRQYLLYREAVEGGMAYNDPDAAEQVE
jgi:hypothetical protein